MACLLCETQDLTEEEKLNTSNSSNIEMFFPLFYTIMGTRGLYIQTESGRIFGSMSSNGDLEVSLSFLIKLQVGG